MASPESTHGQDLAGQLHHVEINVSDIDRSRQFWGWLLPVLGYSKYQEWRHGTSFRKGSAYIVFVQTDEPFLDRPYHRRGVGLNHLAFHARSAEHVDEISAELGRRGIPILYPERHPYAGGPNHYAVFFEDPDRIKIELVAPTPKMPHSSGTEETDG
jgi:catechol 2,3-dioxygenase-like lactoylglutathione lyase family enzyme